MKFAKFYKCKTLLMIPSVILLGMCLFLTFLENGDKRLSLLHVRIPQQLSADLPGCLAIINANITGRKQELEKFLASKRRRRLLPEKFYLNATQDCDAYIEQRGFYTVPLSEEEEEFPIAYSMVIHEKIEMFERLLRAVYVPQNIYCIHVDQKSSKEFHKAVEGIVSCFPNVFVARKLEKVVYASWSRVQADLNCMKDLLHSHVQWKYLLNTCGTDFPIKTNREMVWALKSLKGKNSMESEITRGYNKKGCWQYHHKITDTHVVVRTNKKKSPPPINTPMFMGNAYIVATRGFVKHVIEDKEVQKLLEWEQDTYSPDEHLWATLHRMPSVPGSVPTHIKYDTSDMNAIARLVKWSYLAGDMNKGAPYFPCTGAYRRAVCVYGVGDLPWVLRQHHLFANKFDPGIDDLAIRCLESVLRFKALGQDSLLEKQDQ